MIKAVSVFNDRIDKPLKLVRIICAAENLDPFGIICSVFFFDFLVYQLNFVVNIKTFQKFIALLGITSPIDH